MKRSVLAVAGLGAMFYSGVVMAEGGGMDMQDTTAASSTVVTVTIPGIVGIDIESDVEFDFGDAVAYSAPTGPDSGACPANTFPPPAGCTGAADYVPSAVNHTAGVPGAAPAAGNIWMSVFCNKSAGTLDILARVDAAWTGPVGGPGFGTDALRTAAGTENAEAVGNASAAALSDTDASIGTGTLGDTFGWTRADQALDLSIASGSSTIFQEGTYTATVYFTITKS